MKRKILSILFALVLALSFSLVTAVPAAANILDVPSGTYPTIQDAIDAASDGDTINVAAGIYIEELVFDGDEADNIIIKGATGTADDVVLEGLVWFGGSTTGLTFDTMKFKAVHDTDLFDTNGLRDPGDTWQVSALTVKNCHIVRDTARAVVIDMDNVIGDDFHFINNTVEDFVDAFYAVLYFDPTVRSVTTGWKLNDNKFNNCGGTAIAVYRQNGIEVKNNVIDYSGVTMNLDTWGGIHVAMGRDIANPNPVLIEGNTVIGHGKTFVKGAIGNEFAGISVCCWENAADANATIKGNTITDCCRGISVANVSGVTIEDNDVSGCAAGISPEGVCNGIVNFGNDLSNNDVGILLPDGGTAMYDTAYSNPDGDNVFHYDNIVGNTDYGIQNLAGIVVDATNNWWGTTVRPDIVAMVSDYVDFEPWLASEYSPIPASVTVTATYTAAPPTQIGISVDPTMLDFGNVIPGTPSDTKTVTVTSTGNVAENFSASIEGESVVGVYTTGLTIDGALAKDWGKTNVSVSGQAVPPLILTVPTGTPPGTYTATLVFWAEATQ